MRHRPAGAILQQTTYMGRLEPNHHEISTTLFGTVWRIPRSQAGKHKPLLLSEHRGPPSAKIVPWDSHFLHSGTKRSLLSEFNTRNIAKPTPDIGGTAGVIPASNGEVYRGTN